jgi:RNA polymerase sigma-70 factor (ECF subfamily)
MEIGAPEFETLVAPHRAALHAHCYRMLGSIADADDALQDALLGAWRGRSGFAGRSTFRAWLFKIATNACLQVISKRPPRLLAPDRAPPTEGVELAPMVIEPIWLEPYPDDPRDTALQRETIELAFIAALQHLPANQRAVLITRDVLGFSAEEAAELLDTSVASVTSALQRARDAMATRMPAASQQAELARVGAVGQRELVARFVSAWQSRDVDGLVALLAKDARFSMPPIPSWFDGRDAVVRFFAERVWEQVWRLEPTRASGQLAFVCYQGFDVGALNVIAVRDGAIAELTGFLDPAVHARFRPATD